MAFQIVCTVLMVLDHQVRLKSIKYMSDGKGLDSQLRLSSKYTLAIQMIVFIVLVLQVFLTVFGIDPALYSKFAQQNFHP